MSAMRRELGLDDGQAPWTSRPGIQLRGLPGELNDMNFQNECVDLRFARWCIIHGQPLDTTDVPGYLQTDVRQHVKRYGIQGRVSLLSGSKVYWYLKDRVLTTEEHLFSLWWGDDLVVDGIERALGDSGHKRRRRAVNGVRPCASKVRDLAGNSMALPCLASVIYAGLLASDMSVFYERCTDYQHGGTDGPFNVLSGKSDLSQFNVQDDDVD